MEALGPPEENADPAARTVYGRLLKDLARRGTGDEKRRLFGRAAEAYRAASAAAPSSYALINAATLSMLAGSDEQARQLAGETIDLLDRAPEEAETPYYLSATRAEALLLLGREDQARSAFAQAMAIAPLAWEDHASTLRQFALILEAQGSDVGWLDAHRPPKSLHFGGHMSFAGGDRQEGLKGTIAALLDAEKVGFGFGAFAAGADIIIAEALLDHGAELHAVLPGGAEAFAAVSVDPFGAEWRRRFNAVLARAAEVRVVQPIGAAPDENTIAIADEVAMGAAVMNARRLESHAAQLLVVADSASQRARNAWADAGWAQHILAAPRDDEAGAGAPSQSAPRSRRLALLAFAPAPGTGFEEWLAGLPDALGDAAAAVGPYLSGNAVLLGFAAVSDAARAAITLRSALPDTRIGGHYAAARVYRDPFSGRERVAAESAAAAEGALASALAGMAYVTDDFAAALVATGPRAPRSEYIGELEANDGAPPLGLFVLKS